MTFVEGRPAAIVLLATVALLASCDGWRGGSTAGAPAHAAPDVEAINAAPLGDVAGASGHMVAGSIPNPYAGSPQAVQEGHDLFIKMNCAGCHGYDAKGGMGPDLTDGYWRYGGAPVAVFKSIYEGRPQGMPAWNPALPPAEIWKLVAYVETLGGGVSPGDYQASLQGDRPGETVAPEVANSVVPVAATGVPVAPTPGPAAARSEAGAKP